MGYYLGQFLDFVVDIYILLDLLNKELKRPKILHSLLNFYFK